MREFSCQAEVSVLTIFVAADATSIGGAFIRLRRITLTPCHLTTFAVAISS